MSGSSFFAELRKRKVLQAAAIYGAVAWGVTEVVVTVVEQLFLPQWVSTLAVIGFVVGFPVAMFLAWAFDITSEGIRRTDIASSRGKASVVASLFLLVGGTAGLFLLISPSIQQKEFDGTGVKVPANSVAVLPFDYSALGPDQGYLGQSLSDELRDQLARISGIRIAARSSSIAVQARVDDARSMSELLGVAAVVEGSLRRQGNKLKISVQLIEGRSGLALWSESYERGPNELLTLQREIVRQIVLQVLPEAAEHDLESTTRNPTANELMLLARYYEQQVRDRQEVDTEKLLEAIELYRGAIQVDPDSALAHSRLGGALLYLGDLDAAEAPVFKALALDPSLSEVHETLGLYYFARGMPEAKAAFKRAVELNPNNADALENYAFVLWIEGIEENVPELYRLALELDPLTLSRYAALGEILGRQGHPDEVYEVIRRIEERFDGAEAFRLISVLLELTGDIDRAIAWAIRARDLEPNNPDHLEWLAELYIEIGDFETSLALAPNPGIGLLFKMRRYEELIVKGEELVIDQPDDVMVRYLLAFAYNATGQYESAVWILSSTGLPQTVMEMPRMGADWDGFFTLINSSLGTGDVEVAEGLSAWYINDDTHHQNPDWYVETLMACALSVLGRREEALEKFTLIRRSPRLPWQPLLQDSLCFQSIAETSEYRGTVRYFEDRRAQLRKQLPATLAEFGVSL